MNNETLIVDIVDRLASITINREHRRNAMDDSTLIRFQEFLLRARQEGVIALVITGAGTKAFCAGDDLKALGERPKSTMAATTNRWLELADQLEEFPAPVIAAIEGYCLGGGLEVALACDMRIAGSGATLGMPEARLAGVPGGGATFRLPRVTGIGRAREMIMFGRQLGAQEALNWGLVAQVVPEGFAFERAKDVAASIREIDPQAMAWNKAVVTFSYNAPSSTARYLAYVLSALSENSPGWTASLTRFADR